MVTGDDHDLQARIPAVRLFQETIETTLRPGGRVRHVEHIAGDQQDIRLPFHQKICQKTEKSLVLRLPVVAEKGLAQMPVGRMDKFQCHDGNLVLERPKVEKNLRKDL